VCTVHINALYVDAIQTLKQTSSTHTPPHYQATNSMKQKVKVFNTCYCTTVLVIVFTRASYLTSTCATLLHSAPSRLISFSITSHPRLRLQAVCCFEAVEYNSACAFLVPVMRGTCHSHLILFSAHPATSILPPPLLVETFCSAIRLQTATICMCEAKPHVQTKQELKY